MDDTDAGSPKSRHLLGMPEKTIWVGRALSPTPAPIRELYALPANVAASHLAAHIMLEAQSSGDQAHKGHAHTALESLDRLGADLEIGLQAKGLQDAIASAVAQIGPVTWESWDQLVWAPIHTAKVPDAEIKLAFRVIAIALLHVRNLARYGFTGDLENSTGSDNLVVMGKKRSVMASRLNNTMAYEPRICDYCWRTAIQQRGTQSLCHEHAGRRSASSRKRALRIGAEFGIDARVAELFAQIAARMDTPLLDAVVSHERYLRTLSVAALEASIRSSEACAAWMRDEALLNDEDPNDLPDLRIPSNVVDAWPIFPSPPVPDCEWSYVINCLPFVKNELEQRGIDKSENPISILLKLPEGDVLSKDSSREQQWEAVKFLAVKLHAWLAASPYNALATLVRAEAWLEADQMMKARHGGVRDKKR